MQLLQIQEPGSKTKAKVNAVGIDFGTTNSLVALSVDGKVEVFPDKCGSKKIPSVLAVSDKKIFIGNDATCLLNKENTVSVKSIKRLIGKKKQDVTRNFSDVNELSEKQGKIYISFADFELNVEEISAKILEKVKSVASDNIGKEVTAAVVTVPAYFDEVQRRIVKSAAEAVNIDVMRIINEPTAAALAYKLDKIEKGRYLVYDLGGGTFDVSILDIQQGVFRVIATDGDPDLGGDDFDALIATEIERQIAGVAFKEALECGRSLKEKLTESEKAEISVGGSTFSITRDFFHIISETLLNKTFQITKNVLIDSGLKVDDISGVILVGGSSRMPAVMGKLREIFPSADFYNSINPDEVVAMGAALQAENLTTGGGDLLLDVTPLSLGLEIMGGFNEKIIHRNSAVPCSVSKEFTTYENGQTGLKLHVIQGEREMVKDCRSLANFELKDIPPMEAGAARILVTFTIDADGLLTVSAEEKTKGVKQSIEVLPTYGLSSTEIEESLKDSIKNLEKDHKDRLFAESKMTLESALHKLSISLERDKNLLTTKEYNSICANIELARNAVDSESKEDVDKAMVLLEESIEKFSIYRLEKSEESV